MCLVSVLYNDHMLYDPGGASIAHVCGLYADSVFVCKQQCVCCLSYTMTTCCMTQVGPLLPMYFDSMLTVCLYVGSSVFVFCLIQ